MLTRYLSTMSKNEKNVGSGETEAASYEDKEEEDGRT